MKYDFNTVLDRTCHDMRAVDLPAFYQAPFSGFLRKAGFDIIPMWIADMNFPVCPAVQQAICERISYPDFGYFIPRREYYRCIIDWQTAHNHVTGLTEEHIGYENGLLGGLTSALNVLASRGDSILVHSPTYIGFTRILREDGFNIVHSPLKMDDQGIWRMDFEDMERKIAENNIHTVILCNPHNPCGRVFERGELLQAMEIFERHKVWIIADEIWSDIMLNGHVHTPVQSVSEYARTHTAAFYAPVKTFNLAGLIGAYHIVYDPWLRDRINRESELSHYNNMNVLSMHALIGAYQPEGYEWAEELKETLSANVNYIMDFIAENLPGVHAAKPEGTYLMFLDCTEYCRSRGVTLDMLLKRAWEYGVYYQDGRPFHGECCIRLNFALPPARIEEAFARLKKYVFAD